MTDIMDEYKPPQDTPLDLTQAQVHAPSLLLVPYFFDKERAERLGFTYVYVGFKQGEQK